MEEIVIGKRDYFFYLLYRQEAEKKYIAMEFWTEQLKNASPDDYVFSSDFYPGKTKTTTKRIGNKWKEYVKEDLKINKNFYWLKHLNLDETATILDDAAAAKMAGHTTTVITLKHYLVNKEEREMEKLRKAVSYTHLTLPTNREV